MLTTLKRYQSVGGAALRFLATKGLALSLLSVVFLFGTPLFASANTVSVIDRMGRSTDCPSLGVGWFTAAPYSDVQGRGVGGPIQRAWDFCAHSVVYDYDPGSTPATFFDSFQSYSWRPGNPCPAGYIFTAVQGNESGNRGMDLCAHISTVYYTPGPTPSRILIGYSALASGGTIFGPDGAQCTIDPETVPPWEHYGPLVTDFANWYTRGWCELPATVNFGTTLFFPPPPVNGVCSNPAHHNDCIKGTPANFGNDSTQWTWQCQGSGENHTDASCTEAKPQTIICDTGISCSGACTAPTNTCSANNGTQGSCIYTTYSGGGSCTQAAAPNQSCTLNNCSAGNSCVSGTCTPSQAICTDPRATNNGGPLPCTFPPPPPGQGTFQFRATLGGSPWSGNVTFHTTGGSPNSLALPLNFPGDPGSYTYFYDSGGPSGATFAGITPSATQTVSSGGTTMWTFNFVPVVTIPPQTCTDPNATNNGGPLPCTYPPATCTTAGATNFGGPLPCTFPAGFSLSGSSNCPAGGGPARINLSWRGGPTGNTFQYAVFFDGSPLFGYPQSSDGTGSAAYDYAGTHSYQVKAYPIGLLFVTVAAASNVVSVTLNTSCPPPFIPPIINPQTLTVIKAGTGTGTIYGVIAYCPASYPGPCISPQYERGTVANVSASPAQYSTFTGWSNNRAGECGLPSHVEGSCGILLDQDRTVTATFTADPLPSPPTADLTIRKSGSAGPFVKTVRINSGDNVELKWASTGADECHGDTNFTTGASVSGRAVPATAPGGNTTYMVTCTNNRGGTSTDGASVVVRAPVGGTEPHIFADPTIVDYGGTSNVSWFPNGNGGCSVQGTNADMLGLGPSGSVAADGSHDTVPLVGDTTYTITCRARTANVKIRVRPQFQNF